MTASDGSPGGAAPVDVLVPVRDAASTLGATLRSIRAQTLAGFRCLVLDDGSTDDSREIAGALAREDPRFELVELPPRGIAAALNEGLRRSRAPFVARLDADDLMEPERLELQLALLGREPAVDVVSCRVTFFGETVSANLRGYERWLNSLLTHEEIVRDLFVESPLPHPSVIVRRAALDAVHGYREGPFPEDYDLWLRGWRAGWRFAKRPETLVRIRDHGGRLTKTDPRYTPRAFLECKAGHLVEARGLAGGAVVMWGAGRDGKRAAKALRRRGVRIARFVDIAPTKVGRRTMGVAIEGPDSLGSRARGSRRDGSLVVVAVGVKGARREIREWLGARGFREGRDFVCLG